MAYTCAPSEDSVQPGHPPSLIRVFAVRIKKAWVLSYPLSAQRRLIRLGGCTGWSESSLGAHAILLVLSWGGSNALRFNVGIVFIKVIVSKRRLKTNQTCKQTCCISKGSLSDYLASRQLSLCRVAALKSLSVHRYSVVIFTFSGSFGL